MLLPLLLLAAVSRARELEPAVCAARFELQRDKIIRTEESRAMGARYLSELDVGSRAECTRLCCETDQCDVFVLEEQSPGSCYLFACGPPEDFRCKFTAHTNFSSGVLVLSRRLAELQDAERRAPAPAPAPRSTQAPPPPTVTTTSTTPPPPPPPHCSRYQFACHSGGECIAVYNACDGVPQCADGSDEGPELGCPPAPARVPPPAAAPMWPPRLAQAQPPAAAEPRIFSHTGGLLQTAPAAPPPPRVRRPPPPYGEEISEGMSLTPWQWGGGAGWGQPPGGYQAALPMPELPAPQSHDAPTPLHDAPKKGPPPPPPTAPPPPPPPPPTHTPLPPLSPRPTLAHQPLVEKTSIHTIHEKLVQQEGGPAQQPRAALLLLVLGVCLSVVGIGVGAGCGRRRGAGARRGARGARAASRADYLVNGMYL